MDVRERGRVAETWSLGCIVLNSKRHQTYVSSVLFFSSVHERTDVNAAQHCNSDGVQLTRPLYSEKLTNQTICPPPPLHTPPLHPPLIYGLTKQRLRLSAFLPTFKSCRLQTKHNPQSPLSFSSRQSVLPQTKTDVYNIPRSIKSNMFRSSLIFVAWGLM